MAAAYEVANQALLLLGEGLITEGQFNTPDDDVSRTVVGMFEFSRKAVLRDVKPGIARRYDELALLPEVDIDAIKDFEFGYELPENCLRIIQLFYGDKNALLPGSGLPILTRYRVVGQAIGADENPVIAEYILDVPVDDFDPLMIDTFCAYLAWKMSIPLTESTSKQQLCGAMYAELKRQLISADRSEGYRNIVRSGGTLASARHRGWA